MGVPSNDCIFVADPPVILTALKLYFTWDCDVIKLTTRYKVYLTSNRKVSGIFLKFWLDYTSRSYYSRPDCVSGRSYMTFLKNPSDQELERLGISRFTYVNNAFFKAKLGGICRWNYFFSCFYFFSMVFGVVSACGFGYRAYLEGEWEAVLELIHFIPLVINVTSTAAAYHYSQDDYLQVFRSIDKGVFDYEGTLDEGAKKEITELKTQARGRKQKFGTFYTNLMILALCAQFVKKPLNYIKEGRGIKPRDGENNLVWEAPFGLYIPYADYWTPYIFAQLFGWACGTFSATTTVGSALTYQSICEELIAEYAAIDITLSRCVQRAERLYKIRNGDLGNRPEEVTLDDCLQKCLKVSIKHHQETVRLYTIVKRLLYIPLFFTIFDTGLVLCISGFIIISDDVSMNLKLAMPPVMFAEAGIALMFCYYGEELTQVNNNIGDSIYVGHHWIDHHETVKPYAIVVRSFCDVPNELSAGGFTKVNLMSFANILSAAYSYIGFLLTTS